MRKYLILSFITISTSLSVFGQGVGIGTIAPDPSAILEVKATNKGLLIPRITTSGINSISNPAKGLIVYDSSLNQLMVNLGTSTVPNWQNVASSGSGSGWGLSGNSGTTSNNFIGTTDNNPLRFRVNNQWAGQVDGANHNISLGLAAAQNNTGTTNIAIGNAALNSISVAGNNVAIGDSSMFSMGSGSGFNIGVGSYSLFFNTIGTNNIAIGHRTLMNNSTGSNNTTIGGNGMNSNTTGFDNTAIGIISLFSNTTGNSNVAIGKSALQSNITGSGNVAIGTNALILNLVDNNTAVGRDAMFENTTGTSNTAVGSEALTSNIAAPFNTAVGAFALNANITGNSNTAIGYKAMFANNAVCCNVAVGALAMLNNTTGGDNTAVGYNALPSNTTGNNNAAFGTSALEHNSIGFNNTAYGTAALQATTTGNGNAALGFEALSANLAGSSNTAVGIHSLENNSGSTSSFNTAIGGESLQNATNSQFNTAVGFNAGAKFDLGSNNTLIGANCDVFSAGFFNCAGLGQATTCTASNQARIGNSTTTSIGGFADWTNFSDGRFKKNIQENVKGIDFIMKLRPVTYQLDITGLNNTLNAGRKKEMSALLRQSVSEKEQTVFTGFVAQEVETAAKESGFNFSGVDAPKNANDYYGLRYGDFVVPLVKGMQEQQAIIVKQQQTIDDLQKKLQSLETQVKVLLENSGNKTIARSNN